MYSESDIDAAVSAGVLTPEAASAFRRHVAALHDAPAVDEEHFRLLTGFNDIFVAIALVLLLAALAQIGSNLYRPLGGVLVAGAAWLLAEFFTLRRRMALPSILLLLAFVGGVAGTLAGLAVTLSPDHLSDRTSAAVAAGCALAGAVAAYAHWRRFAVPITVAAGAVALAGVLVSLMLAALPDAKEAAWPLLFVAGLGVFALAMRWDLSDPERRTRRADVAFWLHLAAAPMIAHPVFHLLGVFGGAVTAGTGLIVLVLYVLFGVVALAVDRRALLVSGLAYVLYALYALVRTTATLDLAWATTALVIGSALLGLSAFWQPMRRLVVGSLGDLGRRLPPVAAVT